MRSILCHIGLKYIYVESLRFVLAWCKTIGGLPVCSLARTVCYYISPYQCLVGTSRYHHTSTRLIDGLSLEYGEQTRLAS
jgi:hypothetical protein